MARTSEQTWTSSLVSRADVWFDARVRRAQGDWTGVFMRMREIAAYDYDWDGLESDRPDMNALLAAWTFAGDMVKSGVTPPDRVVSSPLGTVVFEWIHALGHLDQIEFGPDTVEHVEYRPGQDVAVETLFLALRAPDRETAPEARFSTGTLSELALAS